MHKLVNKSKIRKWIYNILFWGLGIGILVLFIGTIIYIWSKFDFAISSKYVSSQILALFNTLIYLNIVMCIIGFVFNMFVFNGEVKKVIDKEHYGKIAVLEFILFIVGILLLIFSPMLLKASNLALDDYKMKTIYCMSYCSTFMGAFFLFYLFSFINLIAEDDCYNKAKPYIYRTNELDYKNICKLIIKKIGKNPVVGEFLNANYKVDYYVLHKDEEFVYAFINLKTITDEFFKLYKEDRLIDFVEYLYKKVLDKKKSTKIMYFICADKFDNNFKDLIDLSIYQDEHFCVVHTLIDLKEHDLYVGGIRDDEKKNVKDYAVVKEEVVRALVDVLEKNK